MLKPMLIHNPINIQATPAFGNFESSFVVVNGLGFLKQSI